MSSTTNSEIHGIPEVVTATDDVDMAENSQASPIVVNEVCNEPKVGDLIGQCKWWSDKLGYGFITVQNGEMKGKDIFVHHSGIRPLNSNYKTLKKGEYINFDVTDGDNGLQAVNVTGIGGGSLICDVNPHIKHVSMMTPPPSSSSPPLPQHQAPSSSSHPHRSSTPINPRHAYQDHRPTRGGRGGRGFATRSFYSQTAP